MTDTMPIPGATDGVATIEAPIASAQGPQIIQQEPQATGINAILEKLRLMGKPTPAEIGGGAAATIVPAANAEATVTPAVANPAFATEIAVSPPVASSTPDVSVSGSNEVSVQNVVAAAPAENPNLGPTIAEQSTPAVATEPAFQAADTTTVSQGLGTVPEGSAPSASTASTDASTATPATQIAPDMIKPGADGGIPGETNTAEVTQGAVPVAEAALTEKNPLTPEESAQAIKILESVEALMDPANANILAKLKAQVAS